MIERHPFSCIFSWVLLFCASCESPLVWNADVKSFIEDGLTELSIKEFTTGDGDAQNTSIPSGSEVVLTGTIENPRSVEISCDVIWEDDTLFDPLPVVSVLGPEEISLTFTPSLPAERKDLVFSVELTALTVDRTYDPASLTLRCNSPPGTVSSSLTAALDAAGHAFAAFRLPSSATDDDLDQVEILWMEDDGTTIDGTSTLSVSDETLLQEIVLSDGTDILETDDPLDRYYRPEDTVAGESYIFIVVIIDTEGLRSEPASIKSDSGLYSVIYSGNGNTGGAPPVDSGTYRQGKTVTVLDAGSLVRTGYTFTGWNTVSDGSGTTYTAGGTFRMSAGDVTLYALWSPITYTINYELNGGTNSQLNPANYTIESADIVLNDPLRSGFVFDGWYSDHSFSTEVTTISAMSTGDIILHAKWLPENSITVVIDLPAAGTIEFSDTLTVEKGSNLTISVSTVFAFYQWYMDGTIIPGATGQSYTLVTTDMGVGVYRLSVVATDSAGVLSSGTCTVLVTN